LTKELDDVIDNSMTFERVLRELVKKRGLRQTARDLGADSGNLYRSLMDGSNLKLKRIEAILDLFGLELKAVKRKEVKPSKPKPTKKGR
jgi:DNA-binding phage protein